LVWGVNKPLVCKPLADINIPDVPIFTISKPFGTGGSVVKAGIETSPTHGCGSHERAGFVQKDNLGIQASQ
jgi:hypothetical protein